MRLGTTIPACLMVFVAVTLSAQIGLLPTKDFTLSESHDPKFVVGDVWEYRTRAGEEHSRAVPLCASMFRPIWASSFKLLLTA